MSIDPEAVRSFTESIRGKDEPLPGNVCNVPSCGGEIVKEWISYTFRNLSVGYSIPFCDKCKKTYPTARNVPIKQGQKVTF